MSPIGSKNSHEEMEGKDHRRARSFGLRSGPNAVRRGSASSAAKSRGLQGIRPAELGLASDVQQSRNALQLLRPFAHGAGEQDLVGTSLLEGTDPVEYTLV